MKKLTRGPSTHGARSGRPIVVLLDLLGRRMALRILWELSKAQAPLTFRALQEAAETNPSVLNARLAELREADVVEHDGEGYRLAAQGRSLVTVILPLHAWAERWASRSGKESATASQLAIGKRVRRK
jgi:DNA-binding HxlR family transcriptional regulator